MLGGVVIAYHVQGLQSGLKLDEKTAADIAHVDKDLQEIESDPSQPYLLRVGTGHPQGGNAMSTDPDIGEEIFRSARWKKLASGFAEVFDGGEDLEGGEGADEE